MQSIQYRAGCPAMDFEKVTAWLAASFWVQGITRAEVEKSAQNSGLVAGAFLPDGTQVAYARAISDKTRFAYVSDVYVDEAYRGQGIGRGILAYMMAHPDMADVYQWLLRTKDAHGVYQALGFGPITGAERWMEVWHPRPPRPQFGE